MKTGGPIRHLGDSALVAETESSRAAHALARALSARAAGFDGVEEAVTGFRSVALITDPDVAEPEAMAEVMAEAMAEATAHGREAGEPAPRGRTGPIEIPVVFDGPDLDDVAGSIRLRRDEVVGRLQGVELQVAFVGFAPGFGYLEGLPAELAAVERRPTPRASVPAGSVAIAGGFAGVYPLAMPGGWHLVGRTSVRLFDPDRAPFALLAPGDPVRLVPRDRVEGLEARGPRRPLGAGGAARRLTVLEAGLLTLVQDIGRIGVAALGVPRAGAADPDALWLANRLTGNPPGAAALECTAKGPTLVFSAPAHVAVVGDAIVSLDGRVVPTDIVLPVAAGQRLAVGDIRGSLRAYLAVDGGLDTPLVLGSRSSDMLCRLGPGPLSAGDELGLGPPTRPHGRLERSDAGAGDGHLLRVLPGPDPFPDGSLDRLCAASWTVGSASDRVGVRLQGPALATPRTRSASRAVVTGAVQVPPDGAPIVLSCDHATVGGYPVLSCVARADLGVLGRCRPGDIVRFEVIDLAGAAGLRAERRRLLERRVVGWFPIRSD